MRKKGFTLVEVALFLALSGLLVAAVIIGTSRSISEKRYNDTVDNFVSYLEGLYASANYVSHGGTGDSSQAVYGKLVIMNTNGGQTSFTSYSIAADANFSSSNLSTDAKDALAGLHPTITVTDNGGNAVFISEETYIPSWGGRIQADETRNDEKANDKNQILLLILRSPKTNMFTTYVWYPNPNDEQTITKSTALDEEYLDHFSKTIDANFCIDSDDRWAGGNERRLVRIHAGANNASGIELIGNEAKGGFCEN